MSDGKKELTLKVAEAYSRDIGRGIARIDSEAAAELGLRSGDVVEIRGSKKTYAIYWPGYPEDRGKGVIRLDAQTRSNAGVGIDDRVVVRKAEAKVGRRVVLNPQEPLYLMGAEHYLTQLLSGRIVSVGDTVTISVLGRRIPLIISATTPAGPVVVDESTEIIVKEEPVKAVPEAVPRVTYEDIGDLKDAIQKIREMIELPLKYPELFERLGIEAPKGVLLYGPPGTGKTLLAKAVATESEANFISIKGPEILSKWVGESEKAVREIFRKAKQASPCVVFFDEIDAIAPVRGGGYGDSHVTERVISQLLTEMDGLEELRNVVVIAATNRPDILDPALLRPGRFDKLIYVPPPDKAARKEIFKIHLRKTPLSEDVDLDKLAELTEGYTGADIAGVCKTAKMLAIREHLQRYRGEGEAQKHVSELKVAWRHFEEVLKKVKPLSKKEMELYKKVAERFAGLAA